PQDALRAAEGAQQRFFAWRSSILGSGGYAQVPMASGLASFLKAAMTESAVRRPVRGFSSEGTFSICIEKRAASASTSIRCMLRVTPGSAQISTDVPSGPIPANANAAATLTLAGNPRAAARAVPVNTHLG